MDPIVDGEEMWRLTMENSPVGMTLVAPDGRMLAANPAFCAMLGYTEDEIKARSFEELTHPHDLEEDLALTRAALAGERSWFRMTKRYLHADGHAVWGDLSVVLLRAADGAPIHFISQVLDVTPQHEYAERLAASTEMLERQRRRVEAVFDAVDVGLVVLNSSGWYEMVNRRHSQFMQLAYPDGHDGMAGQLGEVFAEDGVTRLSREQLPSVRAARGEEFDDLRIWMGADPLTRRALSVSARTVREANGDFSDAALAYTDVTEYVRALRVKDEFVAAVSHELRTPMTSVLGHLEMLTESPDLDPDIIDQLRIVERNAVRLRDMVADLLQAAQMSDGRVRLARSPTDLSALIRDAVEAARPMLRGAGVKVLVDVPADLPPALVDGQRVRQVVDNLLSNAIKYTESGGRVVIGLRRLNDEAEFCVSDTGIGIAPDELEQLFTRFFRGAQAQQRMVPGAGLGLSIVQAIVEAHGGDVRIASAVGEGSTCRVMLPRVWAT